MSRRRPSYYPAELDYARGMGARLLDLPGYMLDHIAASIRRYPRPLPVLQAQRQLDLYAERYPTTGEAAPC